MKKFSFDTIENFDDHIEKSIPNFGVLMGTIKSMSDYFITEDQRIYDMGCSTGRLLKEIPYDDNVKIGYDIAKLLPEQDGGNNIEFEYKDLNKPFKISNACVVYSIFTTQFLKRKERYNYLESICAGLTTGGALFLTEKIYQDDGKLQEIMAFSHYDYKCRNFTEEEIVKKERDLRFIMKPNTQGELEDLLYNVGFSKITTFWQSYNFIGILAIK